MADIRLRVGAVTVNYTFPGSDQAVGDALRRYATSIGINTTQPAAEWGAELVAHWVGEAKRRAKQARLTELELAQLATLEAQAEQETPL
jgi:hypothetical protein